MRESWVRILLEALNYNTMWTVIGVIVLVAAIAIAAVAYYKKNEKGTDAIVSTVEKDASAVATDVKSTVNQAEAIAKKA